jgi:uncharacterized membrane protein YbhN (UPF0104 family)
MHSEFQLAADQNRGMMPKFAASPLLKGIATRAGQFLMIAALYFLFNQLAQNWGRIAPDLLRMQIGPLVGALLLVLAMLLLMALGWTFALRASGALITLQSGFIIYYQASIFRYLPGAIWHLPGRAYLCQKQGIALSTFAQSAFLELFFLLATCGVWAGWGISIYLGNSLALGLTAIAAGAILLAIVSPYSLMFAAGKIGFSPRVASRWTLVGMLLIYILVWSSYGGAIALLLHAIPGIQAPSIVSMIAINSAAWGAGFLSLSPFGLGIRELGLATMLGSSLGTVAVVASLVQRFMEISLECLLWTIAKLCAPR